MWIENPCNVYGLIIRMDYTDYAYNGYVISFSIKEWKRGTYGEGERDNSVGIDRNAQTEAQTAAAR